MKGSVGKYNASRTVVYYSDRITDILHITVDAVGECQELRCGHPNFLLRQFIQPFERILDIGHS